MVIDTKEEAKTLRSTKMFVIACCSVLAVVTAVFVPVGTAVKIMIWGALFVIFLIFFWFQYMMNYTYFYFSNNSKNLIFRFYSMQLFSGKPKTIEISKASFLKYELVSDFFNKKESLVLFQKTDKGVAKYPPISLTLLGKKQKTELKRALFSMEN